MLSRQKFTYDHRLVHKDQRLQPTKRRLYRSENSNSITLYIPHKKRGKQRKDKRALAFKAEEEDFRLPSTQVYSHIHSKAFLCLLFFLLWTWISQFIRI